MTARHYRNRYLRIVVFFAGVIIHFVFWEFILRHIGLQNLVMRTRAKRFRKDAERFRALAIQMGGVMIKVGQFLSSRMDVLPASITDALSGLQDEVPPEKFEDIRDLAESELGMTISEGYDWFDPEPLAAASLGQVHRARLKKGNGKNEPFREVVVKVQRPNIELIVEIDLLALERVGGWLMKYKYIRDHADVPELMREFGLIIRDEINYLKEAENARIFLANFKVDRNICVPRVVSSLTTLRVLTLEDVYSIKITEYAEITRVGIDTGEVARRLFDTYMKQIFIHGFFHADPHPGNLFVTPNPDKGGAEKKPAKWKLTFVDFGMVGRVPETLRSSLRETLIGVGTKDASRLINSYKSLGFILQGADTIALEKTISAVFDRFWGMSMRDLKNIGLDEIHDMGHRMRDVMTEMPFQVPNDLLLLIRAVAILSGMCTGLDPDFNLWKQMEPYARKLVSEEMDNNLKLDLILDQAEEVLKTIIAIPTQTSRLLALMERGGLEVQSPALDIEVRRLTNSINTLTLGVIFTSLLLAGIQLYNSEKGGSGGTIMVLAGLALLLIIVGRLWIKRN